MRRGRKGKGESKRDDGGCTRGSSAVERSEWFRGLLAKMKA